MKDFSSFGSNVKASTMIVQEYWLIQNDRGVPSINQKDWKIVKKHQSNIAKQYQGFKLSFYKPRVGIYIELAQLLAINVSSLWSIKFISFALFSCLFYS